MSPEYEAGVEEYKKLLMTMYHNSDCLIEWAEAIKALLGLE